MLRFLSQTSFLTKIFLLSLLLFFIIGVNFYLWQEKNKPEKRLLRVTKNYAALNLRQIYPEEYWLGREQERERWIVKLESASLALSQGNKNQTREDLLWVQKAIQNQNRFPMEKSLDQNKDGIADYMEEVSGEINKILKEL